MAIPFTVEDDSDYEDVVLQQLFSDLCRTLQQIAEIQSSRRMQNLTNTQRVRSSNSTSRRPRTEAPQPAEFAEGLFNSGLSPAGTQNELETFLQPETLSLPARRLRRRRSQSGPSLCEEVKPVKVSVSVEVTNKDWIQQQEQPPESGTKKKWCASENLFSKLVPAPFGGPLWTAVVCVVGWHLLRTR